VIIDAALANAMERARGTGDAPDAQARLIHDLAITGAEHIARSAAERERLLAELADPDWTATHLDSAVVDEVLTRRKPVGCAECPQSHLTEGPS
jgi:hypothetical protein